MSARVLAVGGESGSSAKTTTTVTAATLLAKMGLHVVVADFDSQANATEWFGIDPATVEATSGSVLLLQVGLRDALRDTNTDGVRVLPAAKSLIEDAVDLEKAKAKEVRLKRALRDLPDDVDVVLVDCPGSMGVLTGCAMVAADALVTVTTPGPKELKGIPALEQTIADLVYECGDVMHNPDLTLGAVVPCRVPPANRGRLYGDAMQQLREAYGDLVTPPVRESVRVPEASSNQVPLPVYAPRDPVTLDYEAVIDAWKQMGVL